MSMAAPSAQPGSTDVVREPGAVKAVQGWLGIKTRDFFKITREEGYNCKKRDHVPISESVDVALENMKRIYQSDPDFHDLIFIPVGGVPEEKILLKDDKIWALQGRHLPTEWMVVADHSQAGLDKVIKVRGSSEHDGVNCPFCDEPPIITEYPENRGINFRAYVGLHRYWVLGKDHGFASSPCHRPACIVLMIERTKRLNEGPVRIGYHMTTPGFGDMIMESGGFIRGAGGMAGEGIYFAQTPRETEWKAQIGQKGPVLKVEIKMGTTLYGSNICYTDNFKELQNRKKLGVWGDQKGPFDSVILDRSCSKDFPNGYHGYPVPDIVPETRIENLKPGQTRHDGYEFVVYSWDQVTLLGEVPRDPEP